MARSGELDHVVEGLRHGDEQDLQALSRRYPNFPKGIDPFVGDPWIVFAMDVGSIRAIRWMLEAGIDIDAKSDANEAPIHACLERASPDRYDVLQELIAAGADIQIRGRNDWTPLHLAAARNDVKAIEILLKAGADIGARTGMDTESTPEEEALRLGAEEAAKTLKTWRLKKWRLNNGKHRVIGVVVAFLVMVGASSAMRVRTWN